MSKLIAAGQEYTPEDIMTLRQEVIDFRDTLLAANDFYNAVTLSHTIALLYVMVEDLKKRPDEEPEILMLDPSDINLFGGLKK